MAGHGACLEVYGDQPGVNASLAALENAPEEPKASKGSTWVR